LGVATQSSPELGVRRAKTVKGKRLALAIVIGPPVVLGVIWVFIYLGQRDERRRGEVPPPPVGAGAGHTGMYNEYMKTPAK
jgi:hypothetical protein